MYRAADALNKAAASRRKSRIALLQAFLPASVDVLDLATTKTWLRDQGFLKSIDKRHFNRCLAGVAEKLSELDRAFAPFLENRQLDELGQVEKAILRVAAYEIQYADIPFRVVINEWVEIAKNYGAENSYRYVNGVLDRLAQGAQSTPDNDERIRAH